MAAQAGALASLVGEGLPGDSGGGNVLAVAVVSLIVLTASSIATRLVAADPIAPSVVFLPHLVPS